MHVVSAMKLWSVAAAAALGACGGAASRQEGAPAMGGAAGGAELESLVGRVGTVGAEPMVMVTLQTDAGSVRFTGPLEGELRRLAGARVEVEGTRHSGVPMATFEASAYRVVEVDGQVPVVGVLVERDGVYVIQTDDGSVTIDGVPAALRKPGAKVWVTGRRTGAGLYVQSFGVIRDP